VLLTAEAGYLLRVQPEQVDAVRFQRLVQEGRRALDADNPVTAAERLHAALRLWRGPIPDEVAGSPFAQDETARLEGLYLTAREARIQADLGVGRHAELLPELELLTAQQPDHEGLRRLLALALYRSHRVDEAAETCRRGITRLLARGHRAPALQQLQTAILRRAPELDWRPPGPARHPRAPTCCPRRRQLHRPPGGARHPAHQPARQRRRHRATRRGPRHRRQPRAGEARAGPKGGAGRPGTSPGLGVVNCSAVGH
jgi:Bacterial transcriptional activator domain